MSVPPALRVPLRIKLAFGAPGFAGAAMAIPIAIHLTIFYSDVILVPLGFIALVKAAARAFDALTDPLMGWISDRTKSRFGRRRPWIVIGAPLCALSFLAMFAPPEGLGRLEAAAWFAVTYTGYYLFNTVYQIPHYGLGPEITQDYRERSTLFGWSEGFSVAGTLVAAVLPPLLIDAFGGPRQGYVSFAILFGSLLTLLYFHLAWRVHERPDYVNRPSNPLVPGVRRVMRNRVFRLLLAVYLMGAITGAIPGLLMPYFTKYVLAPEDPDTWLAIYLAAYFGAGFVCLPLWVAAARHFGKKSTYLASFVTGVTGLLSIFFLIGPGDELLMVATLAWSGSSFGARLFLGPSIQADVIDYDELHTGRRREAQYGGLWSVMTKFTVIPSMSVPLAILASIGYVPNVPQTESVQFAIRSIFALAPAVTSALAFGLACFYPITSQVHARIIEGIQSHRRGEDAVDPITGEHLTPPATNGGDDDASWFMDHFSRGERRALDAAGPTALVRRVGAALATSVTVLLVSFGLTARSLRDLGQDPGLGAVMGVLAIGLAFTACLYHGVRLYAARRLRNGDAPAATLLHPGEPERGPAV